MATTTRMSQGERREEILEAALDEFADHGYHGGSTEGIARRAGISQPYVFRLFGTKQELFKAVVARCFRETLEMLDRKSTRLNSSHVSISYAVFCLKKKSLAFWSAVMRW